MLRIVFLAFILACLTLPAWGAKPEKTGEFGPKLGSVHTQQLKVGLVVSAGQKACKGILCTTPVPIEWPEQQVKVMDEEVTAHIGNISYRMVGGTVRQMVVEIPHLAKGEEARAIITFEITRHQLIAPDDTSMLKLPEKPSRQLKAFLGVSPGTETRAAKIKALSKEVGADAESDWERVEAYYDWVRENIEYKNGDFRGAMQALKDGYGDCEEMTALFCALCRAGGIPARTVWVPGHCYPEFYLEDEEGIGYWFPCQAAGARAFGGIPELRPIFQKGDNFITAERPREKMRYVSEFLTGVGGAPKYHFIREVLAAGSGPAPLVN